MEYKKTSPASQQPIGQQHLMAHQVHPEQIYSEKPTMQTHFPDQPSSPHHEVAGRGMHQLINQYNSYATARSPLLENRHELYGTGHIHVHTRPYGANDNYNSPQLPPQRVEKTDLFIDYNVNHELLYNIPKGYNAEVYQDYLKRNPPKDTNQIYHNHQPTCRANNNQYGSKPYLPFSNRIGPQSNTELLRRQYNEIQQMKFQQQMHYQNQAQMQQQQTFAERQLLLQQLHGVQPPPNLQHSIYPHGSYRDLDQHSNKNDIKEYSDDISKEDDKYVKNNEYKEPEKPIRLYQESQWQANQYTDIRNAEQYKQQSDGDKGKSQFPEYCQSPIKNNVGLVSPMNSSESSSPSLKSPSSDSRRSSGGSQALRSPVAQRSPSAPVTLSGILYKQGSDGLRVWRKRWFVLAEYCLFYYKSQHEEKLLGSVLLPSYKVSECTADDKALRKFSFKLEHANVRTYVLATPDQESMIKWMKALTMAALMQSSNEQPQKQFQQLSAKPEGGEEVPGPTYANAPPKPRRSNEGYNSPSPDMYNSSYDLLKKPASQGKSHTRYQEHINYPTSLNQERTYNRSLQSPPFPTQQPPYYQTKQSHNTLHLFLPLTNFITDRDVHGEINRRPNQVPSSTNEHLLNERRTPDAYGRSASMLDCDKGKIGDYEDVYGTNETENKYGKTYSQSPPQARDVSSEQHLPHDYRENYTQEKTFSGPSVLRRRKMPSSGIQSISRPHSADFLKYEAKTEILNRTIPPRSEADTGKQPRRPKSSLDINSFYDPSSDRHYSEESYAEKMRQSALYLQHGIGSRNIQIPLAKYASGIAEKQLNSLYFQNSNKSYESEFGVNRSNHDNIGFTKYCDSKSINCNWTLKEKENQENHRSGSVMSDSSNVVAFAKDLSRYDHSSENFVRSASARLPSTTTEKEGVKKVKQREESMKRLLEWKQRMLQSPLTRKSTPATISLARSLNQSRQSLRSDQCNSKMYANASYNSYSSDDEEETSGTDLQKPRDMQAGRSNRMNIMSPIVMRSTNPFAPVSESKELMNINKDATHLKQMENTYVNILCTKNVPKIKFDTEELEDIFRNEQHDKLDNPDIHESETKSETQLEYTDNDLDEALLKFDKKSHTKLENVNVEKQNKEDVNCTEDGAEQKSKTPPAKVSSEDHYLPMSPRKASTVKLAHRTILQNLSVFDLSMPLGYEDNPYVEMNVDNEEEDMQTYETVCVNNGKNEPVYMELYNVASKHDTIKEQKKQFQDTASHFAATKDTLKNVSKRDRVSKENFDYSDTDDEASKDISLDIPFSRFSISDTFRPASYYLITSRSTMELQDSSDSETLPPSLMQSSISPCEKIIDDALSKYILDKLDKSGMSHDNSLLKMLTSENQKMNTVKTKTTSLMIYGSRTSVRDTLSRAEKIRNSRASLYSDTMLTETPFNLLSNSVFKQYNSSGIDTDSIRSYNADRGSSRLSLESDVSRKFEVAPSNVSPVVANLNDSEVKINLRYLSNFLNTEMMIKRRPFSDNSIFKLNSLENNAHNDLPTNADIEKYLDNLQPSTSGCHKGWHLQKSYTGNDALAHKDVNIVEAAHLHATGHTRCSSTPISHTANINSPEAILMSRNIGQQVSGCTGSHISSTSIGVPKSPISYYCKKFDEEKMQSKNSNSVILADKIKELEGEKLALKIGVETKASSSTTCSRGSSTEHSAPYYYSDLSSQEHINFLPTSHCYKHTNLHRKLNNQRRRGLLQKKNEIPHIHNPIRRNQMSDRSFEFTASARSVSVEFLSAADKDSDIDLKNFYEFTRFKNCKIPESMKLISGLGCKKNTRNKSNTESTSPNDTFGYRTSLITNSTIKVSDASLYCHCSENSSNTVYYDAEAEACVYENIMSQGEMHWDEDSLWRDNLRKVSHRHARSMDDLDSVLVEPLMSDRAGIDISAMNSFKRVKKNVCNKISRNVTYVNCDIQNQVLRRRKKISIENSYCTEEEEEKDQYDTYVSLAETAKTLQPSDYGVYEQLAVNLAENSLIMASLDNNKYNTEGRKKRKFEIDREKLRQWDLMSSGLMKGAGCARVVGASARAVVGAGLGVGPRGTGHLLGSTDTGTDSASNEGIL